MKNEIIWLEHTDCKLATLVGSKAANLSLLATNYRVPIGFSLTTKLLATFEKSYNPNQSETLPLQMQVLLQEAYSKLEKITKTITPAVAVRSSAEGEDSKTASFAGQYDTYLNVLGKEALYLAVSHCWAAAKNERVQVYSQKQGQMAIFIQQLISADISLVAFSLNPTTENTNEIIVNSTWGLGESLVSGTVTPDTYTIQKSTEQLLLEEIATKTVMTILAPQGIREVPIPRPMQQLPSLDTTKIKEITNLVKALEKEMGWPVDVECAYQNDQLYLLQCRPITTFHQ